MSVVVDSTRKNFWGGVWRFADPKVTLASVASMFVGAALAWSGGQLHWGWLAATVLGIFCIEAAKNASGEIVDFYSGTDAAVRDEDRSPFSGGKRVLVDGMMVPKQAAWVAAAFYLLGCGAGIAVVMWKAPQILWIGLVGVGLAFFYHAPPLRLSYRGLGEIAVAFTYGPLIMVGTYGVHYDVVPVHVWLLSIPLGTLVGAFLWINEFPDYAADREARKNTWVVRLGRPRASKGYAVLVTLAYAILVVIAVMGGVSAWTLFGLAGLPLSLSAAKTLLAHPEDTAKIVSAQGKTLLAFVVHAIGLAVGVIVS